MEAWSDHLVCLRDEHCPSNGKSVFAVRAGNVADHSLFLHGSEASIRAFLKSGYSVYLLDVDTNKDYMKDDVLPQRNLAFIASEAMLNIPNLAWIQFYAHARYDINFTDPGAEFSATPLADREDATDIYNRHRIFIGDLKIGKPAAPFGLIDLFMCMTHPKAVYAQLIADTLGWPVRTVAPGYSIYFPRNSSYPKAQIPSNRLFSFPKYDPRGWVIWLPHWPGYIQASEPGDDSFFCHKKPGFLRFLRRKIAVWLEPFREWRKKRMKAGAGQ